jgi:bla regulator protein blaR1
MLHYILQTIAFQLFFLIIYDVFLKRDTFFNWNRAYLLITTLLSIILPFIKIEQFKDVVPQQFIIKLPEVILGSLTQTEPVLFDNGIEQTTDFIFTWKLFFIFGATIAFLLFIYKLIKIAVLIYKNPKSWQGNMLIVKLINSNAAFSFFHYVFLGERINNKDKNSILKHETIHVKQKHSIDLLLFEILRILFWFNPLVYMYQSRIRTLHEFIADAKAVKTLNKLQYYENLLTEVFETQNLSFINTFFKQSLIKKRIVMLTKSKSKQILKLKYALLIPMVFGMLLYTSCESESVNSETQELSISSQIEQLRLAIEANPNISNEDNEALTKLAYSVRLNQLLNRKQEVREVLEVQDYSNASEIPFTVIDEVPIYPGCETLSNNAERRKCMSDSINKKVQKNFNTDLAKDLGLKGKQRINVIFKIDKTGSVTGIRSRALHPRLEAEAIRVISLLPKMIPGKHQGKNVIVPYALPIVFQVADGKD